MAETILFCLIDARAPLFCRETLSSYIKTVPFMTVNMAYPTLCGHPDIFFTFVGPEWIVAPGLPEEYFHLLEMNGIRYLRGERNPGGVYPQSCAYNAVLTANELFHHPGYTETAILKMACGRKIYPVRQGYTRCNLLLLGNGFALTSDRGIEKVLLKETGMETLFVEPEGILLSGQKHGFIGGTGGVWQGKLFLLGSLRHLAQGERIRLFVERAGLEVVELYPGPLFDGGGLFFFSA